MQSNQWSTAALDALLLSIITVVASLIQVVFEPGTIISILLWIVKLVGCLALLYYFVKEYSKAQDSFTYKEGFSFGFKICLLSSVVLAAYNFLQYAVLFPESMQTAMEQIIVAMQSSNPDAAEAMESYQPKLPQLISIVTLFYYTVFGVIASAVIANYTKKGDIFTNNSI
ncbi:MAG: DUF4199 domain-containing protein [Rikenellaceae bacterium]|nr:DUF4199 domain-containing protein [Rikenellaceae bacterium]